MPRPAFQLRSMRQIMADVDEEFMRRCVDEYDPDEVVTACGIEYWLQNDDGASVGVSAGDRPGTDGRLTPIGSK